MISSVQIADALGLPHPTQQQQAVIEAPCLPSIVIAGAGSGKTETMANRVVWLIVNGHVRASEVLGLTFTRKAAGELADRIRLRLDQLRRTTTLMAAPEYDQDDPFDTPTIATYNSFANGIFREHALLIGKEPDATILSEASAWHIARRLVVESTDSRLIESDRSVETLTAAVLSLSRAMSENMVSSAEITALVEEFNQLEELPTGSTRVPVLNATLAQAIHPVRSLPVLTELADRFTAQKILKGSVEYSDQVAFAVQVCQRIPAVPPEYRQRFRVVLLDEYQDTSVLQTRLLSTLFANTHVMAVGDPHQSIYGWRGASAANLARFSQDFTGNPAAAHTFSLSTSWRNPAVVLEAANALVEPLHQKSAVPVQRLQARPGVQSGALDVFFGETINDEADACALWFAKNLATTRSSTAQHPSAALLCRSVKKIEVFTAAFAKHGVPYRVLGLGGLLEQPVIADLVATLRVMHDPTADAELIRVLAGAKWMIGTRDIAALGRLASWLTSCDYHQNPLPSGVQKQLRASAVAEESRSLIDALDFLLEVPENHPSLADFSTVGRERLRQIGRDFSFLRTRSGLDLPTLVLFVQQHLLLDIEGAAHEAHRVAQAFLEAFNEQVSSFVDSDPEAGLGPFLAWLAEAERRDKFAPRLEEPEPGTVQILTVHGAKGLEWDFVAVPRMVDSEFPAKIRNKNAWLSFGELPFEFRADAAELPQLPWRLAKNQADFVSLLQKFSEDVTQHYAQEQRRLAYVALTRAKEALLLSGSFWFDQLKPRAPGLFLRELVDIGLIAADVLPREPEHSENPLAQSDTLIPWPRDPLGSRRERVVRAAEAVAEADPQKRTRWSELIALLLAEQKELQLPIDDFSLIPGRIAASRFKDYVADPQAVLRQLRRPLPEKPYSQTRLGTCFHSWLEQRYSRSGVSEILDAQWGEHDHEDSDFLTLQRTFEQSEWAGLAPVEVEVEIHLMLDDQVVVCKIDAVFFREGRYQVVDWKTGKPPRDDSDRELKQLQLALYRLAYAEWKNIDLSLIDAAFYFVSEDIVVVPETLQTEAELRDLWNRVSTPR